MKALIDGDIITYRCGFAAEQTVVNALLIEDEAGGVLPLGSFGSIKAARQALEEQDFSKKDYELVSVVQPEPIANALYSVRNTIENICKALKCSDYQVYLTGGDNFRNHVATLAPYKGNRKDARRPHHYDAIREYLVEHHRAIVTDGIEADDILADDQTKNTVICSIDKDLLQIPGKHYNWVKDEKTLVTPDMGHILKWRQVLTGDSTDNIPGIRGLGPKAAIARIRKGMTEEQCHKKCVQEWGKAIRNQKVQLVEDYEALRNLGPTAVVEQIHRLIKVGGPYPNGKESDGTSDRRGNPDNPEPIQARGADQDSSDKPWDDD
jgi:hypothetical protein